MTASKKSYFRPDIDKMSGYVPGEQPKIKNIIKLNTNESPYPPAPGVQKILKNINSDILKLYPDPVASELRRIFAGLCGFELENVIAGNGSDDILTMIVRSFSDENRTLACLTPSYSLYIELAKIQGAKFIVIPLEKDFSIPKDLLSQIKDANIFLIPRPNSPTSNSMPKKDLEKICKGFKGIVVIDEAYADFAEDNCLDLVKKYDNVIITRTLSKSYALAAARLGFAISNPKIIEGLFKVKDSYNVNKLTQEIGLAALKDQKYLKKSVAKIIKTREYTKAELEKIGFNVIKSDSNFLFAEAPDKNGLKYFEFLRENAIIVRYFPGELSGTFVRISIGTDTQMKKLISLTEKFYN